MRILIVDFEFPEPDRSSGGHRLYRIIELLREEGHELAFLSIDYWQIWKKQDQKYPDMLKAIGVETHRDGWALSERGGKFIDEFNPDAVILSKYYMANMLISYLRVTHPFARLILDTVDVHFLREQRQGSAAWPETRDNELAACNAVDRVWAITPADHAEIVKWNTSPLDIHVVPNIHNAVGPGESYEYREGIVFVGNYVHEPNKDAVRLMHHHIMPQTRNLGCPDGFLAVGPYNELLPKYKGLKTSGYVEDLNGLLSKAKVGVAPLTYGAGMKGKVGSYMCNGLPVVTTKIGAEGMGLVDGETALIRELEDFPVAIQSLYEDKELWNRLSCGGLKKVTEWSSEAQKKVVKKAVAFM
jgi:glycosyltransferase involved in cell wall biosynthesis